MLARRYAEAHPLTLALDIDVVRAMLGGWLDQPTQAGLIARGMAIEMARVHLTAGRDVLVPQFLGRVEFIIELEQLCRQVGAEFLELVLLSNSDETTRRFVQRSSQPESPSHRDAAALLERSGGVRELPAMYNRMLDVVASRTSTVTVATVTGDVDQAYRDLVAHLDPT